MNCETQCVLNENGSTFYDFKKGHTKSKKDLVSNSLEYPQCSRIRPLVLEDADPLLMADGGPQVNGGAEHDGLDLQVEVLAGIHTYLGPVSSGTVEFEWKNCLSLCFYCQSDRAVSTESVNNTGG